MAKQEQILDIEPQHELKFVGPFARPVTSYLKITNPSNHTVGFKIKTTAPKKYCVRPNSGLLEPKEFSNISVTCTPFEFDSTEKIKDKFLVQSMIVPEGEEVNNEAVQNLMSQWKDVNPENLMDSKLKCVFEIPEEQNTTTSASSPDPSNAVEEKAKRVGDSASVATHDGELVKAAKEVKHLREEESSLRQENLQLKEEILRLRTNNYGPMSPPVPNTNFSAPSSQEQNYTILWIVALVMVILGVILGKYIL